MERKMEGVSISDGFCTVELVGAESKMESEDGAGASIPAKLELEELEKSLMTKLAKEDDWIGNQAGKIELISKLEVSRGQSADEKRLARRTAWIENSRREVLQRVKFRKVVDELPSEKEVWSMLLKKLDESQDKAMVSNMSLLWRDLLKAERTTFLFHKVFPLRHQQGDLSTDDITKCRALCKKWKRTVDACLQNNIEFRSGPEIQELKISGMTTPGPLGIPLLFLGVVSRFTRWSAATYSSFGNPFISRNLLLAFPCMSQFPPPCMCRIFWNEVEELLTLVGGEVWQFAMILNPCLDLLAAYDEICKFLKLMPNLKCLMIRGHEDLVHFERMEGFRNGVLTQTSLAPLKKRMSENPLPRLPHLKVIHAKLIPSEMMKGILNQIGSGLESFSFMGVNGHPNANAGSIYFPQLKHFSLIGMCSSLSQGDSRFTGKWPLVEDVSLQYAYVNEAGEIVKLFQCLNGLGGSVRKVFLDLLNDQDRIQLDGRSLKMMTLELPLVEEFFMGVSRIGVKSIDFLLPMKSLKELTMSYTSHVASFKKKKTKKDPKVGPSSSTVTSTSATQASSAPSPNEEPGEIIQYWNYTNRLYESNIWKLFPELRKVVIFTVNTLKGSGVGPENREKCVVNKKIYTREGYKQHCQAVQGQDTARSGEEEL